MENETVADTTQEVSGGKSLVYVILATAAVSAGWTLGSRTTDYLADRLMARRARKLAEKNQEK